MGNKKGVARKLEISCAQEEDDKFIMTGPDDDGDLTVEMDAPNEGVLSMIWDHKRQEQVCNFLLKALGKKPLTAQTDED